MLLKPLICSFLILFHFCLPWREVIVFVNFVFIYSFAFHFFYHINLLLIALYDLMVLCYKSGRIILHIFSVTCFFHLILTFLRIICVVACVCSSFRFTAILNSIVWVYHSLLTLLLIDIWLLCICYTNLLLPTSKRLIDHSSRNGISETLGKNVCCFQENAKLFF